jgi:hypothetical protein
MHPGRVLITSAACKTRVIPAPKGCDTPSLIIYRLTSLAMRRLFTEPKNTFHTQEAVISVLVCNLFSDTPLKLSLTLFKAVYYSMFTLHFASSGRGYRRRQHNAKAIFTGGTMSQDEISHST